MMTEEWHNWQKQNSEYLAAALGWLRLCLARLVAEDSSRHEGSAIDSKSGCWNRLKRTPKEPLSVTVVSHPEKITDEDIEKAVARLEKAAAIKPPPTLVSLKQQLKLSDFEQNLLLLCAAMELDPSIPYLCACAQNDDKRPYPTFNLARNLFSDPEWGALASDKSLRYWRLIQIDQPAGQPLTNCPIRIDMRIVHYITSLKTIDEQLSQFLVPFDKYKVVQTTLPPTQQDAVDQIISQLKTAVHNGQRPIIQLLGHDPFSKWLISGHAAVQMNVELYRLPVEAFAIQGEELGTLLRLLQREFVLHNISNRWPFVLYLDAQEIDHGTGTSDSLIAASLKRFLTQYSGIVFFGTREIRPDLGPTVVSVEVDKPTPAEQQAAWADALTDSTSESPALLGSQFNLNIATIRQIADAATSISTVAAEDRHEQLWDACLANTQPRLDMLAQHIDAKATWDDIVLPPHITSLLQQITGQVGQRSTVYDQWGWRDKMNRGLGISALFAGDSGTGKTMAAEVIANALRLNLYRIDLSAVVSKFIGETEKNLRRLFDAAEDGGTILFFDEADALFGKRTEVKDSHDRYANIEINYLLQRMEGYRGLAILATNMKSTLDDAFLRRLRFIVDFPFPGVKERKLMWQKVFPQKTKTSGLDYDRLAKFSLTGGNIHNIALNASFLAAHEGQMVTMQHVLLAAQTEFRKLERPFREADFAYERQPTY